MSDDGRYFDEGDVKAGKREFDFKGREGQGPDDWDRSDERKKDTEKPPHLRRFVR